MENFYQSLVGAVVLAVIHVMAGHLRFLNVIPRSHWLSIAGGVAVAYALVHLLPEVQHYHETLAESVVGTWLSARYGVWVLVLVGLVAFYGLEKAALEMRRRKLWKEAGWRVFLLHISSYGFYNALLGYLLVREDRDWQSLALFVVGIGLHFVVNDHSLREHHPRQYHNIGRWILAGAVLVGWLVGVSTAIHEAVTASIIAFLAGGILLNTFKEELPEQRSGRFWAFAAGAFVYAAILVAVNRPN